MARRRRTYEETYNEYMDILDEDLRKLDEQEKREKQEKLKKQKKLKEQGGRSVASVLQPGAESETKTILRRRVLKDRLLTQTEEGKKKAQEQSAEAQKKLAESKRREAQIQLVSDLVGIQRGVQEINQAQLDYQQMESEASLNKQLIDEEINEIVGAGQAQAGLERAKGETRAEMSQLKLAAQGQNLSGEGARAVTESSRIMAATRAADARSNALSKVLGLEYEQVGISRRLAYGGIQKSLATQSGFSRIAFGIADAAVNYKQAYPKSQGQSQTTDSGTYTAGAFNIKKSNDKALREGGARYRQAARESLKNAPWNKKTKKSGRTPASVKKKNRWDGNFFINRIEGKNIPYP